MSLRTKGLIDHIYTISVKNIIRQNSCVNQSCCACISKTGHRFFRLPSGLFVYYSLRLGDNIN